MKHHIDPKVDYPFKAIFGAVENRDVLLDFLNAVLHLDVPVVDVEILNPFVPADFEDGRAGVVDVLAKDSHGRRFQVEIQRQVRPWLVQRMLCAWADLYPSPQKRGAAYAELRPVFAIWILDENLLPMSEVSRAPWHHCFELRDQNTGCRLTDQLAIHTVELRKWHRGEAPLDPEQNWIYFLKDAGGWDELPPELTTSPLRKAMAVLERIADKQEDYYRYLSRLNLEREQRSQELRERENARLQRETEAALEQARAAEEQARAAEERALDEIGRLRERLRALGVDPDAAG